MSEKFIRAEEVAEIMEMSATRKEYTHMSLTARSVISASKLFRYAET